MHQIRVRALWPLIVVCLALSSSSNALAQSLELKRVMLSAGGVGYFEHEARVSGDAVLELSVRLDQVDDVLKSIVVYDDTGRAGAIRLPGRQPLQAVFRDLPFTPDALDSSVRLLQSLSGARIEATGPREVSGRLVSVTPERARIGDDDGVITRHRVSVMTGAGLQTFVLEDAEAVRFADTTLAAQVDSALAAVAAYRTRDRRTLEVVSRGDGDRLVRVGYVVSVPLWKASYRLSLPQAGESAARLQGWAVLENMSGQDWRDVELTLVSGNPVTFRQALYAAYYVDRPEIPVEVLGRVLPAPDDGAVALDADSARARQQDFRAMQRLGSAEANRKMSAGVRGLSSGIVVAEDAPLPAASMPAPEPAPPPAPSRQAAIVAAASTEAATSVTFRIPQPVSVASGHSMLAPVVDARIPAERISLYQPDTHPRHPLAAVRLSNDTPTSLPPGVLTLYERVDDGAAYIGDAELSPLPRGEQRLLSYALDQKTTVDREMRDVRSIAKGRIVNGVLEIEYASEQRTEYRLKAPSDDARALVLEHPRLGGWELQSPRPADVELTSSHYRITQELDATERKKLEVVLARPTFQKIALIKLKTHQFAAYASNGQLDRELREAFVRMRQLREVIDDDERRAKQLENERKRIYEEQKRIRNNLSRVPRDSDLHKRYIRKLDKQEDALEALLRQSEELETALEDAHKALRDYVAGLDL